MSLCVEVTNNLMGETIAAMFSFVELQSSSYAKTHNQIESLPADNQAIVINYC